MKVTSTMTNDSGNAIDADFLGLDGVGWKLSRDGDLGVMVMDSSAWPNETGRFSAADLVEIAGKCMAVAAAITADYGADDPYADGIRKAFTRERA